MATTDTASSVATDAAASDGNITTAAPPQEAHDVEDSTVWVPYLSLICLVVVFVTLACSFRRHRKRVIKRRRNISDYLELNIDLNRKRLFGMMRMPFDACQESFSASADFSTKSRRTSTLGHQNSRQYSYDFHFPQEPAAPVQLRGGFQRHESTIHPMPGVDTDDSGYSNTYDYASPNPNVVPFSCGSQRLCHHHCIVSCPFCWRAVQNEMGHLFDKTQDYLYQKNENSPPNSKSRNVEEDVVDSRKFANVASTRFENSDHDRQPMGKLQSNSAPAFGDDSGTVRKGNRNVKTMDLMRYGAGSSVPKITTQENGIYTINKRTGEDETTTNAQERKRQNMYSSNFHGHSDTELTPCITKKPNHQPVAQNSLRQIRTNPNLSSQSSSSISEIPARGHSYKRYKLLSKVARLNFPTGAATPYKSSSAPTADPDDDDYEARPTQQQQPGPSRSVAFTNTAFRDPNSPSPSQPQPESLLGTEGVINYGFQSDLSTAFSDVDSYSIKGVSHNNYKNDDLSNNKYSNAINDHIIDASSPNALADEKQSINDKNYSGDFATTIKRKKKKPFLKTHTKHSAESSSETPLKKGEGRKSEFFSSSSSQRRQSLQPSLSRQPNVPSDHCIDLSVIEVGNTAFERIPSADTISNDTKSFNNTSNDINV